MIVTHVTHVTGTKVGEYYPLTAQREETIDTNGSDEAEVSY